MKRQTSKFCNERRGNLVWVIFTFILIFGIIGSALFIQQFRKNNFKYGTTIQGISCSFLNVKETEKQIEKKINEKVVTIKFINNEYSVSYSTFDFQITSTQELQKILEEEHRNNYKNYTLVNSTTIDTAKLKEWLVEIPDLNQENMILPQNAYIHWNGNQFTLVPEVLGNWYDFEEVYQILTNELSTGIPEVIDLQQLAYVYPQVSSEELIQEFNNLEGILSTTVNYKLTDGTSYTLNREVMKQWVVQDKDGSYNIDITSNLPIFIEKLDQLVKNACQELSFNPTGLEEIVLVPIVDYQHSLSINEEEEYNRIFNNLGYGKTLQYTPIYNENSNLHTLNSYVELDITRQHIWMYVNGICIVDTGCVTGNISQDYFTPLGVYFLDSKTTNRVLRGYNRDGSKYSSWVQYWMPFYKSYGLHDATWRASFGGEIYKTNGSHGCVNLPYDVAGVIYQNIDNEIPIIIYES